mgnify:CR=1 FL=1
MPGPTGRAQHDASAPPLPELVIEPIVRLALLEDFGRAGDVTTDAVVAADTQAAATFIAREGGVAAGYDAARLALKLVDPEARALRPAPRWSPSRAGRARC